MDFRENGKKNLENLETSDIKASNERLGIRMGFKGLVDLLDNPLEETLVGGFGQCINGGSSLFRGNHSGNPFTSGLDTGLGETLLEIRAGNSEQVGNLVGNLILFFFKKIELGRDKEEEILLEGSEMVAVSSLRLAAWKAKFPYSMQAETMDQMLDFS